jgi:DNA polymerase-3 subunit epsilon
MDWKKEPILYVDTETTGVNPEADRIVELAMALMMDGDVRWSYVTLVNPEMPIPEGAAAVHKIHDKDVVDAPIFAEIMEMVGLCMDYRICGAYNAPFDKNIIKGEFYRCGVDFEKDFWIDPLVVAKHFVTMRGRGVHRLDTTASRLGIDLGDAAHTAAADTIAAGKVMHYYADKLPDDLDAYVELQSLWAEQQWSEWVAYCSRAGRNPGKRYH